MSRERTAAVSVTPAVPMVFAVAYYTSQSRKLAFKRYAGFPTVALGRHEYTKRVYDGGDYFIRNDDNYEQINKHKVATTTGLLSSIIC